MIDRICISINNRCNLACKYCHFHEKGILEDAEMNVYEILDNVKNYATGCFKIGFVGNGECFLDWEKLKSYISYIEGYDNIRSEEGKLIIIASHIKDDIDGLADIIYKFEDGSVNKIKR